MSPLLAVLIVLSGTFLAIEIILFLLGSKLQTRLNIIFLFFILSLILACLLIREIHPVYVILLWGGFFLAWFGVRSHIESSILLRILHMIHKNPGISPKELIRDYEEIQGTSERLAELERGGFFEPDGSSFTLTSKGRYVARILHAFHKRWGIHRDN
ncbi:hypothetical protein ACFLT9_12990 [Acidobacteriota bacterium]